MIEKLYNLKKTQTDQKISQQGQVQAKIDALDEEINNTQENINTSSVDKFGAISDFTILEIHKNTMKIHITKLQNQKSLLLSQISKIKLEIVELQKETEQYGYILKEEKREAIKKLLLAEEEASSEYMQSKYIRG